MKDPIVEEIRRIRHAHAARFNFDLRAICKDLREKERTCGHPLAAHAPKPVAATVGSQQPDGTRLR